MIDERNPDPRIGQPKRKITPLQIGIILAAILIAAFAIWTFAGTRRANPDKLPDSNAVTASRPAVPEKRCASQATYDLIKRELFRRAAVVRGADQGSFSKLADYAVVRIDRPLLESEDDQTSAISCSGTLTLDLPPGVAVVGGRRTLTADIGYALQRSADGNGEVLTLTSAESVITPLATIARAAAVATADPLAPIAPPTLQPPLPPPSAPIIVPAPAGPPPPTRAPAPSRSQVLAPPDAPHPSFNCANARTRGEIAVCGNRELSALDRQMAAQYVDALRSADPQTRSLLQRSRDRFLGYRDQCPSAACIAQTYRGRMREIRDIADGSIR